MTSPRYLLSRRHNHVDSGTHADYSVGTSFAAIDATNLTITIPANVGDVFVIACQASFTGGSDATIALTASVNGTALGGTNGLSLGHAISGFDNALSLFKHYTVAWADIVSNQVTVVPLAKASTAYTIRGSNPPVQFSVLNIGPMVGS